jgi:hypothetical protein
MDTKRKFLLMKKVFDKKKVFDFFYFINIIELFIIWAIMFFNFYIKYHKCALHNILKYYRRY